MKSTKTTLVGATAAVIATGDVSTRVVKVSTALADVKLGGAGITSAAGFPIPDGTSTRTIIDVTVGSSDLYALSAGGGDVIVLDPNA